MLYFFRKFQKILFIFITVIIIISFSFFGAISSLNDRESSPPDQVIGTGLDGSHLMRREVSAISQLISSSPSDRDIWQKGQTPHLLNDSVIQKDLMATGMALLLARQYFEALKPDLEERLPRLRNFRPYSHPQYPEISVEHVWERHLPKILYHLNDLRNKTDQMTQETLAVLFELYLDQVMFPPDIVKQILMHQQNHLGVEPDPMLINGDLHLFGFHSLEDWFGPKFVELTSQFILNAASFAKQQGYQVSQKEIRADLFRNIYEGYSHVARQTTLSSEEADQYYRLEMQQLGMDEPSLLKTWRQVMLFRKMFNDVGDSIVLDSLLFEQMGSERKDNYEFSPALQLNSLDDVCQLQVYLEGISRQHACCPSELSLPLEVDLIEEIEKRAPFLVERRCEVEYAQVTQEELLAEVSLKQTWNWQVDPNNWDGLMKQFPHLLKGKAQNVEERLALLDQLSAKERLIMDQFARAQIVAEHPERIGAALDRAQAHVVSIGLREQGGTFPWTQKEDRVLASLIEQAPIKGEERCVQHTTIQDQLNLYSADGQTFYRIAVMQRNQDKSVLTYEQARNDGTLAKVFEARLAAAYPNIRKKNPTVFQEMDGSFKPVSSVTQELARHVYAPLLKQIEATYEALVGKLPEARVPLDPMFYVQNRLLKPMADARKEIAESSEVGVRIHSPLVEQWKVRPKTATSFPAAWKAMKAQSERNLALDARRTLMVDLLKRIREKRAIDLEHHDLVR